ncbi:MAG: hypothetical protein LAO21_02720 [Acidobacteriia bacterium]|nr:hypothetical protein [Terriglobia bacterium]
MKFKRCLLFTACLMGMVCFLSSTLMVGQTDPSWRLWYPQVVNGVIGNNTYVTSLIVSNPSNIGIEVALEDFDHNSPDQWLRTSYTSNCKVVGTHFFLPAFATCRLDTDGVGPYESGWLRISEVTKSNNLGGYLSYTYYQGDAVIGTPLFTVGVSPMPACSRFSIPVLRDVAKGEDTAFAVVNPNVFSINLRADLFDVKGLVDSRPISLLPQGHVAQFVSQLFPSALGNATKFVGNLLIYGLGGNDSASATALIQRKDQYGGATTTLQEVRYSKMDSDYEVGKMGPSPEGKLISTATGPKF